MHTDSPPRRVRRGLILCVLLLLAAPASALADVTATLTPAAPFAFAARQAGGGPGTARTHTLTSTGTDPLTVTGVALTGANPGQFRITDNACADKVLTTGQTCVVRVAFDPSVAGAHAAALEIATSGPTLSSGALSGTGRDLAVSAASLTCAAHVGSASAPKTLTITNEAADPRTLALCSETTPSGRRASGGYCPSTLPAAFDDPASPLDGTHRDVYLAGTTVANADGPARWWTDPYGGNASPEPFPGAVCQLVAPTDTTARPAARTRVFGRNVDHDAEGVHAPN